MYIDDQDYDDDISIKREFAYDINARAKSYGLTLVNDGAEVNILVANSRDGKGRYTYENRETRKRSGSYARLKDMLPLEFAKDKGRKNPNKREGERRF